MPILNETDYVPPYLLTNPHVQSIMPSLLRPTPDVDYVRERIPTPDNDFLLIDWSFAPKPNPSRGLVIITHGLEGHSHRKYVRGMARAMNHAGWDVLARNCRGCGGETNLTPRLYHSGETDDLHTTVQHALSFKHYSRIALIGFSMGANQTLKYLGESPTRMPSEIVGAVAISAPCDLSDSATTLESSQLGKFYTEYLLRSLRDKVRQKHSLFPDIFDIDGLDAISTFREFDDRYTAPQFGFRDAMDYWEQASSRPGLSRIKVPTLILNAKDDPFLGEKCFPTSEADNNPNIFLETPKSGGHVGFIQLSDTNEFWSEKRAAEFLRRYSA